MAPDATSTVHVGPMGAGDATPVYFYLQVKAQPPLSGQTHTITVFNGEPGQGGSARR